MAPSIYRDEALVTLTVVNPPPKFEYPTRHLVLRKTSSTVPLGRMSKRNGIFAAAEYNGWIDSAVMSRDHAKLIFDPQAQRVFLKDIGSLHGTFINNTRLKKLQAQAVKDGDYIQFGIPVDRGTDTCPPCIMRVTVQYGAPNSLQGPTVFRVPDDSDDEVSAEDDMNTRNSCRILREHGLRPAKNCIRPDDPTITIELSDQEMDSPSPEPEDQTASTRSIQDHITEKTSSEKSPSRVPTPPETIDITDEDALFYGDDFGEDDISGDEEDDHSSPRDDSPDHTLRRSFLDNDHSATHLEATEIHEAEIVDRFENDCLPPILNFSPADAASAPNQPLPSVHLPSFYDTFRSQEISVEQRNTAIDNTNEVASASQPAHSPSMAPPELVEPKFWPEDVAHNRATESSSLLDSGAEFLKSPLKEQPELENAAVSLDFDETSAYQFEVTKNAITQQQQQQQQQQNQQPVESESAPTGADQPVESPEKPLHNKRKAEDISEMTAEEAQFAQVDQAQDSSSLGAQPRSVDDSAMDISEADVHSGLHEPPVKRLRKAAEIFGYAALGGVAVMSALIATAPTL